MKVHPRHEDVKGLTGTNQPNTCWLHHMLSKACTTSGFSIYEDESIHAFRERSVLSVHI